MQTNVLIQPQPGKQYDCLASQADIVFFGGAAGGGKTYALLLEGTRALTIPQYGGVIFRREATELTRPGGIWAESQTVYGQIGWKSNNAALSWKIPEQGTLKFAGLQLENDMYSWKGAQLDFLGFDEVTEFTERQFWYLFHRLRSRSGAIKPYCRATCNPEANWVYDLVRWWIDEEGFAIPERSGVIRWFGRIDEKIYWFKEEKDAITALATMGLDERIQPKSFTFIPSTINDNPILLRNNPEYYATLAQAPADERDKLLMGNWKIKPVGKIFNINDFQPFAIPPSQYDCKLITVDTALSTKEANDFTVFQCWCRSQKGIYFLAQVRGKFDFGLQLSMLHNFILTHNPNWVGIEQKASGISLLQEIRKLVKVPYLPIQRDKDKYTRGKQTQSYVQSGYVFVNRLADYYTDFVIEVSNFSPENKNKAGIHDDIVDPMMDAIDYLLIKNIGDNKPHEQQTQKPGYYNPFDAEPETKRTTFATSTRY